MQNRMFHIGNNSQTITYTKEGSMEQQPQVAQPPAVSPILEKAVLTANLLGIRLTLLQREHITTLSSQAEANKYILGLKDTRAEVVLPEATTTLLRDVVSHKHTATYINLQSNLKSYTRSIEDWRARTNDTLRRMHEVRLELHNLDSKPAFDMNDEVKKCLADGWWELHSITQTEIKFITNDITCSHIDEKAGINMSVGLGRMQVTYRWSDAYTKVTKYMDNTDVNHGYYHPHVASDGDVCWGNTENVVYKARQEHKLHTILTALRQLLAVYNPESPYAKLIEWDLIVNKAKYEGKGKVYKKIKDIAYGRTNPSRIFIRVDEGDGPPSDDYYEYKDVCDSDSGDEEYSYDVYVQVYDGINEPVSTTYYIKKDDEYVRFNNYNWEWL